MSYEPDDKYPVLVEYTVRHVVWVEAPSQEDAVSYAQEAPYEYTDDSRTVIDGDSSVRGPGDWWDWHAIEVQANAHVVVHQAEMLRRQREAEKAACAEAGHPDAKTYDDRSRYCPVCWSLPAAEAVA